MFPCIQAEDMIYFLHQDQQITQRLKGAFELYDCI